MTDAQDVLRKELVWLNDSIGMIKPIGKPEPGVWRFLEDENARVMATFKLRETAPDLASQWRTTLGSGATPCGRTVTRWAGGYEETGYWLEPGRIRAERITMIEDKALISSVRMLSETNGCSTAMSSIEGKLIMLDGALTNPLAELAEGNGRLDSWRNLPRPPAFVPTGILALAGFSLGMPYSSAIGQALQQFKGPDMADSVEPLSNNGLRVTYAGSFTLEDTVFERATLTFDDQQRLTAVQLVSPAIGDHPLAATFKHDLGDPRTEMQDYLSARYRAQWCIPQQCLSLETRTNDTGALKHYATLQPTPLYDDPKAL